MKMKKLMTLFALMTAAVALGDGLEYIYWQVDLSTDNPHGVSDFSYATVKESGGTDFLWTYNFEGVPVAQLNGVKGYEGDGETGKKVEPVYSGVAADEWADSYLFELWQENTGVGADTRVGYATYTYAQLKDYIAKTMSESAAVPLMVTAIPEPTSALLLLLGVAGLALRRRRRAFAACAFMLLVTGAHAAGDNLLYGFQPDANDMYADGTPVLIGERYALVWLSNGSDGVEIAADCTVIDSSKGEIVKVRRSDLEEKGEEFVFQVDAAKKDELVAKGGKWAVYLLDTRVYGADGAVTLAAVVDDKPASVNAAKKLSKSVVQTSALGNGMNKTIITDKDSADVATAVPAGAPQPEITGVEVVDGKVHVKIGNTVPYLQYNLAAGESPTAVSGKAAESPRNGVIGDEIELVAPVSNGSAFFKVNRN